jgi:amino acid transporter
LDITERYPFLNAVWFVVVVSIAAALWRVLGLDDKTTFVAVALAAVLFVVIVIYREIWNLGKKELAWHAKVFSWAALIIIVSFVVLLMSSVFFGWPLGLQGWLDDQRLVTHWEYFTPLPPDPAFDVPYYKKTTIRRKGGDNLQYRIVEEPTRRSPYPPWGVFIQFSGGEPAVQAVLTIPDHSEIAVDFIRGKPTFELRSLRRRDEK